MWHNLQVGADIQAFLDSPKRSGNRIAAALLPANHLGRGRAYRRVRGTFGTRVSRWLGVELRRSGKAADLAPRPPKTQPSKIAPRLPWTLRPSMVHMGMCEELYPARGACVSDH